MPERSRNDTGVSSWRETRVMRGSSHVTLKLVAHGTDLVWRARTVRSRHTSLADALQLGFVLARSLKDERSRRSTGPPFVVGRPLRGPARPPFQSPLSAHGLRRVELRQESRWTSRADTPGAFWRRLSINTESASLGSAASFGTSKLLDRNVITCAMPRI